MNQNNVSMKEQKTGFVGSGIMLGVFLSGADVLVVTTGIPTAVEDLGGVNLYNRSRKLARQGGWLRRL
jgi:hypothetical protein